MPPGPLLSFLLLPLPPLPVLLLLWATAVHMYKEFSKFLVTIKKE